MAANKMRRQKAFVDQGFGFPVVLFNVPTTMVRGTEVLDINYKKYAHAVLQALANHPRRLTGDQIRFIRHYFGKTLKEFAHRFGQKSHQAVLKWEACAENATNMNWAAEKDIRLFILDQLDVSAQRFQKLYSALAQKPQSSKDPVRIEANKLAA